MPDSKAGESSSANDDEQTPLLPRDVNTPLWLDIPRAQEHLSSSYLSRISAYLSVSLTGQTPTDDEDDPDAFDNNELIRHRARLSSWPTLPETEWVQKARQRRKRKPSAVGEAAGLDFPLLGEEQNEEAIAEEAAEWTAGQAAGGAQVHNPSHYRRPSGYVEKEDPDRKYIGVSPLRFWLIFSVILLGFVATSFDQTFMATSHPVITSYFNASESASWLNTVFMIATTVSQPLWGRLSDTIGRKIVYIIVLTIYGLTNIWAAPSTSIVSFIAARAVCGLGAGGTMCTGLIILSDLVRVEHRGIYMSHINVACGVGLAIGAAFGGILCDRLGWRWGFGLQVPVIAVCVVGAALTCPNTLGPMLITREKDTLSSDTESESESDSDTVSSQIASGTNRPQTGRARALRALRNFDFAGLTSLAISVTFLILFFNLGGTTFPWRHWIVLSSLALCVLSTLVFVVVEGRAKQPVMPLRLLVKPPIVNLMLAHALASVASNTVLFNVPIWFQAVKGISATSSGLRLAAPNIGGGLAGVATGYIITYTRRLKPTLLFGAVMYVAGSIVLCLLSEHSSTLLTLIFITGTPSAQGFVYPASMMSAFAVASPEDQAVVTTSMMLWRNLGIVVGVSVSSLVFQNMLRVRLEEFVVGTGSEVERRTIIKGARSSVGFVKGLSGIWREQVVHAYASALKSAFVTALIASVLLLLIIVPCKLPKLRRGKA